MIRLALLVMLTTLLMASAATAATPLKYRQTMNAICRAYTPKIQSAEEGMAAATTSQRKQNFEIALRTYLQLGIQQNHQLEAVRVPKRLSKQMRPVLTRLKKLDPHLRNALAHSRSGNASATRSQLDKVIRMSVPLNGMLDAAGLIDCGSNQP